MLPNKKAPHTNSNRAAIPLQRCRSAFRLMVRGYSTRIGVYSEEPIETLGADSQGPRPQWSVPSIPPQIN